MPGRGLPLKLHGRLTQGCLGCKETHPSVSGCLLCKYLSHIFPLLLSVAGLYPGSGHRQMSPGERRNSWVCSGLSLLTVSVGLISSIPWSSWLVTCPRTSASHATDRLLTPGLRGSLKIAGRVGTRTWLGFERNYKEIILRGFFLQWIMDSHGAGVGCPHYAHIITVLARECSQGLCSDAARIPSLLTRPKKADMSRQNAGVTHTASL